MRPVAREGRVISVGGISAVADEATHSYPHCLFVKCHSTFSTLIRGDRGDRGGLSALADDVDLRGSGCIGVVSVASSSCVIGRMDW